MESLPLGLSRRPPCNSADNFQIVPNRYVGRSVLHSDGGLKFICPGWRPLVEQNLLNIFLRVLARFLGVSEIEEACWPEMAVTYDIVRCRTAAQPSHISVII